MTWLDRILANPTLTVGIIGFAGVILTLSANAWLARQQRRNEQRHERQTLRAALIEELKINRESLALNVETLKEGPEPKGAVMPTDLMDDAYRAFVHRIGALSQAEVRRVMFAYLSLRTYNAKLFLMGFPPDTGGRHIQVPPENAAELVLTLEYLIGPIDEAIKLMESVRDK
jgi:hypothetical protein